MNRIVAYFRKFNDWKQHKKSHVQTVDPPISIVKGYSRKVIGMRRKSVGKNTDIITHKYIQVN